MPSANVSSGSTVAGDASPQGPGALRPGRGGPGLAVALAVAGLALAGVWWWQGRQTRESTDSASAPSLPAVVPSEAPAVQAPTETALARAGRLESEFDRLQTRAAKQELTPAERAQLAEATLLAEQARTRLGAGDAEAGAEAWARAVRLAGPLVLARAQARHEAVAAGLREVKLEDHPASQAQALAEALRAASEAASRGAWTEALARHDEALELVEPARKAIAAKFAEAGEGASQRGDLAMATLFHERALRLDAALEASRAHLYRHKFKAGHLLRTSGGIELAYAPPAEFLRGSPADEPGRDADEPLQRVVLTKGFFVAVSETTQRDWDRAMGAGESARILRAAKAKPETISPDLPMHSVTWEQAADYCRKLSEREGLRFRLPTEAEWEYACRAGTTTAFNLGVEGLSAREANIDDGSAGASLAPRAPGASGRSNAWGLRDMHGNLWEWCSDWSAPYENGEEVRDPAGPAQEAIGRIDLAMKVVRGGGWNAPANDARSANRWEYSPAVATGYIGLRIVHDPDLTRP